MKKLRCESCGGELRIEENGEYASCDYCRTKYKLNEDHTLVIKLDDSIKNAYKSATKMAAPVLIAFISFLLLFGFMFGRAIYNMTKSSGGKTSNINVDMESNPAKDIISNIMSNTTEKDNSYEVHKFNSTFELYRGTTSKFHMNYLLDSISSNNQKYERKITVVYNTKSTTDYNEIIKIKQSLKDNKKYEVKFEYDQEGYINKTIIEDIK